MSHYVVLETEKYLVAAQKKTIKKYRSHRAIQDFKTFVYGLAAMAVGAYIASEIQTWLPIVTEFAHNHGIHWI